MCVKESGCRRARELAPDIVLTDLHMPGADGLTLTKLLLALPNPPAVLILTACSTSDAVAEVLRSGANGYLLKDAPPERITAAVHMVACGGIALTPATAGHLLETPRPPVPSKLPTLADLTSRQRVLLTQMGCGLSNARIAQRLCLTESTVKTYVSRLLRELGLENRTQAAIMAHQLGLLDPDPTCDPTPFS